MKEAQAIASRLLKAIQSEDIDHAGSLIKDKLTVSIGISTSQLTTPSYESLLSEADEALYMAKKMGRACGCHFTERNSPII
jgi:diguanylate cyclase (GGDEF)-like protein